MTETPVLAPDFSLPATSTEDIALSSLRGGPFVLFFYPRDDTSGCTKEAIAFSQLKDEFDSLGCAVFGVSKDSLASHEKFTNKHDLTISLLSDEAGTTCEDYGVWKEKSMYGKKFMGIERSTFLIDSEGTIASEWRKVKVPGHAEAVLAALRAL
ncbi:MAG: peroxiredoxin [Pseudoprimorskyibacter sp.]|nr:peroxiredoxin [Pseudoprimorskyibacter sp.]